MPVKLLLRLWTTAVVMSSRHERGKILYTKSPPEASFACSILRCMSSHGQDRTMTLDILRVVVPVSSSSLLDSGGSQQPVCI